MKVVLRSSAKRDVAEAVEWYEDQRVGLGDHFLIGVRAALDRVSQYPRGYPVVLEPALRRILLTDFPYGLFYLVETDRVVVTACLHVRQSPRRWSNPG